MRWEGAEGRGGHGLAAQPDVVRLPGQVGVSVLRWVSWALSCGNVVPGSASWGKLKQRSLVYGL